nr:pentatricopeptide repeat-containing protein At1g50270 [Ipomoea batatas]
MSAPIPSLHEALISLLLSQKKWSFIRLKQIHSLFITCGLCHHNSWLRKLLDHCISLPAFPSSYALSLFTRIKEPNAHSWNTMIKGYSMTSNPHDSIVFYAKMRKNRVFPNNHTFNLLLKAFSKAKAGNPLQVFAQVVKFGFGSDHFVQNSLVSTFAVCGHIELSRKVFVEMQQRDVISYTALIDGFKRNNRPAEALELFLEMKRTGVRVDEVPGRVHQDIYIGSALVDMYSKCGFCDDASEAFAEMPCKNLVSWTALIAGYVNCERFKNALNAFEDMQVSGLEPNQATLTVLLTACTKLGALDQGKQLEKHIDSQGLEINLALGSALIDLYAKCGCINDALLVFRKIPVKDVYVWTAIINGLAMHGEAEKCLDLFREMLSNGVEPDGVTFIGRRSFHIISILLYVDRTAYQVILDSGR